MIAPHQRQRDRFATTDDNGCDDDGGDQRDHCEERSNVDARERPFNRGAVLVASRHVQMLTTASG
ncbi:MAG: hypothetical protein QOH79_339 [Acidimicrobiaceae bacterium]